ncbi:hypothetical protein PHLGIDRAFT_195388 [Phlebiopsis gigantea 11061_1 CR5-6]|uniref:Autophagy-related protein 17 n=1 Tax=Phlebiopsis gigantea (strain 11061_1 CR5-6) TaxID=745531 RepID=A0A0C3PFL5_PHLG1|nr:hypothetical protein PHLGIDRAFT_195388 [Phlebiopsis gigantea 11061_1 CR5-6]
MADPAAAEQPHLMSLVLQSKKAFLHGEQLCKDATGVSAQCGQIAADVLALSAKVRWMTDAVREQLKLAANVAEIIERKRAELEMQAKEWDNVKNQRTAALDTILDSLGTQLVPPDFHSTSPVSSLFGSQEASEDEADEDKAHTNGFRPGQSPTETLRDVLRNGSSRIYARRKREADRTRWKTLRDFVDERAIEDKLDDMDSERATLDNILAKTSDFPNSLQRTISAIHLSLPGEISIPPMDEIFASQETISESMANHFSSLVRHYHEMRDVEAQRDAGEVFHEADIQVMNRDTEELPSIIADLEKSSITLRGYEEQLAAAKGVAQDELYSLRRVLDSLDELAEIISDILESQQTVQSEFDEQLSLMHTDLGVIEDLHSRYTSYQYSYCKLVVELARRRRYAEAAAKIVQTMSDQLDAMAEEEREHRENFNVLHEDHLPLDVCPGMRNPPTRYEILPWNHESEEISPYIPEDLLQEAVDRVAATDAGLSASQSL